MKLNIITDRYFPDIIGGGEISLGYTVQGLKGIESLEICILAQSENLSQVSLELDDHVKVVRIPTKLDIHIGKMMPRGLKPGLIEWFYRRTRTDPPTRMACLVKLFVLIKNWCYYLFSKTNSGFKDKLSLLVSNFMSHLWSKENEEYLDCDFSFFNDTKPLYDTIRETACDIVHADNTRSILRYIESDAVFPSVAVVRDLKFICPRRTLIAHTTKGPCTECNYQCLDALPLIQRPFIKRVLKANMTYRQNALKTHTKVICTSTFLQNMLRTSAGVVAEVIPNPASIAPPHSEHTVKINREQNQKIMLFVGMLVQNKGPDIALDILHRLLREGIHAKLLIAGRGMMLSTLREKTNSLNLENKVEFLGFLNRGTLADYYRIADVVICPTRWPEPFGRVPLEAMSIGVPVVAFKSGGFVDTILDGETGFMVAVSDIREFTEKVKILLTNDKLKKKMGKRCKNWAEKKFSIEKIAHKYFAVYRTLCRTEFGG